MTRDRASARLSERMCCTFAVEASRDGWVVSAEFMRADWREAVSRTVLRFGILFVPVSV